LLAFSWRSADFLAILSEGPGSREQHGDEPIVKRIAILPTLLTLGNAVCGFAAIVYASKINPEAADSLNNSYLVLSASLIFIAMVFDALDGYAARLSKSASEFGAQLDSLCDAISFGAAPAFLLLKLGQDWNRTVPGQGVAVIAALYMVCAVLRLARFNLENSPDPASHKRFKGLPSPGAAGCLASLAFLRTELTHGTWTWFHEPLVRSFVNIWAPLGALTVALLMVSRLPYPHFTKQLLRGRRPFAFIVRVVLVVFAVALTLELAFLILFWLYALTPPLRHVLYLFLRRHSLSVTGPTLEEARPRLE
jgi:CDP-diacylglycerol--serine O-phosphatidyltransferase